MDPFSHAAEKALKETKIIDYVGGVIALVGLFLFYLGYHYFRPLSLNSVISGATIPILLLIVAFTIVSCIAHRDERRIEFNGTRAAYVTGVIGIAFFIVGAIIVVNGYFGASASKEYHLPIISVSMSNSRRQGKKYYANVSSPVDRQGTWELEISNRDYFHFAKSSCVSSSVTAVVPVGRTESSMRQRDGALSQCPALLLTVKEGVLGFPWIKNQLFLRNG